MFQKYFQIYAIFLLCILVQMNYGILEENKTIELGILKDILPIKKCDNNCPCAPLLKFGNIICEGNNDSYIKQLTFNDTKYLPERAFLGYRIDNLILDGHDMIIDENVFEGMVVLKNFQVKHSSIKIIPDFRAVENFIHTIQIESSLLTSLEGTNLQNLTNLEQLSLKNNSIRSIDTGVFQGTDNMKTLDLSYNLLTLIPPNILDSMRNLKVFRANHNNLLHADNLFTAIQPDSIELQYNNITNGSFILQLSRKNYKSMVIIAESMDIKNFHDTYLYPCLAREHRVFNHRTLSQVSVLDISYNSIEELTHKFFPCYKYIDDIYMVKVGTLKSIGNKLRSLNTLLRYSQVSSMDVSKNQIQYLTDEDFTSVYDTVRLVFAENQIRRIDSKAFKPMKNFLQYLDLSYNLITSINGSIQYLDNLHTLKLEYNFIQTFAQDEFSGLHGLSKLILEHNNIKTVGQLQQLAVLRHLYIKHNDIRLIRQNQLPKTLETLQFADNPFMCNCRLLPFILELNASNYLQKDTDLCLRSDHETSAQKSPNCPEQCSCICTDKTEISYMFVDCSSRELDIIPQFLTSQFIEITHMKDNETNTSMHFLVMDQITYPSLQIRDQVSGINLENNNLETLDADQLPPNLTELYLSNNKLRWLPDSLFENQLNLQQVSLSGNPWNCDCNALKFKKWLISNHDSILDINDTRCATSAKGKSNLSGRIIWTLTDLDLCPSNLGQIIALSFGVLIVVIFCFVTLLLYNIYNLNIKVFLYSHGFTFVKEEDIDHDKMFDAFISFSNADGDFVSREIIDEIEKRDPNIRLCLHYRHFRPGEFIHDNITLAVQYSKRTILILSRNFLESEWCLLEFRTAHTQALNDKIHRIIMIKVGDLPKEMDSSIKVYLDSTTYLTWGENNFWNKLLYVLPSQSSVRNPVPNKTAGDNESVLNYTFSGL